MAQNPTRRSTKQISGEDIVVETAWLYYHDGLNQSDIAAGLMVSRATVVNYLQEARERGYIHTKLSPEAFNTHRAALKLCERFGLKAAYILPDGTGGPDDHASRIIRGAADWLPSLLEPGDRLGIAWGKTIYDVAEQLEQTTIPDLTVLQLVGSMATPYGFSADVCSSNVARKFSANCINLHVPAILSSAEIAATLRAETLIAHQFEAVSNCNKTLFAVGSCNPDSHIVSSGLATLAELEQYKAMGAVGVLCGRFIDAKGDPVSGPLDERMMGVELEKLRHRDAGILVSVSEDRAAAAVAALRGGYATHVVTNQRSASAMMDLA
ncbi:sugar-binding transcriptional regulator [Hoeflea sp. G2-23]|uniref:Sugar-binding transcriptional regulator n=1 Tax=Hoeflea algicola TaxID=2983763 RepID=A0ABT3Z6Q6_9HYPH|nr:sugar-binding transcriptional regulator [Hoeflea algicola]MCY0147457.1 sugar-binding transcriptional regulator [Hoeflea algicola]